MRNTILSLLFMMCATTSANAQTFLDQLKKSKPGEGKVTVTQSKDIDNLVNGVKGITTTTTTPKTTVGKTVGEKTKVAPKPNHNKDNAAKDKAQALYKEREREHERENASERKAEGHKTERTTEETGEMSIPTVDMSKKVMRNSRAGAGFRRRKHARRQAASTANRQCHQDEASRPAGLRAFLFATMDLPSGQLSHLWGGAENAPQLTGHGIQGRHNRQGNHHRTVLKKNNLTDISNKNVNQPI